ncbi:MAG: FeoA family protein [Myxococcaceae bacterium]
MTSLAQIPLLKTVRIRAVGGDPAFRRRLLELGFLPGVEVKVLGAAPMGDPLQIEIRGCQFSMRKAEAQAIAISVAPLEPERAPGLTGQAVKAA